MVLVLISNVAIRITIEVTVFVNNVMIKNSGFVDKTGWRLIPILTLISCMTLGKTLSLKPQFPPLSERNAITTYLIR